MNRLLTILAAAGVAFAPAAFADPGKGHGDNKHAEKRFEKQFNKHGYAEGRGYVGAPPGLAKKPYGLPPGQAKKMWRKGERLPRAYYVETRYIVVEPQRYRLPPPPYGYRWVRVNGDAYLVQTSNGLVANVVANAVVALLR